MPEAGLREMADDIKANGLHEPVFLKTAADLVAQQVTK
jgi:hypothetical protein